MARQGSGTPQGVRAQSGRGGAQLPLTPSVLNYKRTLAKAGFKPMTFRPAADEGENGSTHDIPIAQAITLKGELPKMEPAVEGKGDLMIITGTEVMCQIAIPPAIGGVTSTVPQGGIYAMLPVNPMACDGMRVAQMMAQYDQFHVESVTYEYVPFCNATQPGGLAMAIVNDADDPMPTEGGFGAIRDISTREGSVEFNVYAHAACTTGQPLLEWYYTGRNDDIDLVEPGVLYVIAGTDVSNATASTIPLGIIRMHYCFYVRAPSIERPIPQTFYAAGVSLTLTAMNIGADAGVVLAYGSTGLPAAFNTPDAIGWGVVVSADDAAFGGAGWRTWLDTTSAKQITVGPGNLLFWRSWRNGGTLNVYFYATFADANTAVFSQVGYQATVATTAGVKGFKLFNVNGCVVGDA